MIGLTEFGLQSGPAVTVSFQSGRYLHAVSGGEFAASQKPKNPADNNRDNALLSAGFSMIYVTHNTWQIFIPGRDP